MNVAVAIYKDLEQLSLAAAEFVHTMARETVASTGSFLVALAGGRTPSTLYGLLGAPPYAKDINWNKVHFFWGDERFVPHQHADSNYGSAKNILIDRIPIPHGNIHPVPFLESGVQTAADLYEEEISDVLAMTGKPCFDLILLGVGSDGHTASLFPGDKSLSVTDRMVTTGQAPGGQSRITLTYPAINSAGKVLFIATGHDKAAVIRQILRPDEKSNYPAARIAGRCETVWFLDEAAATYM